MITIYKNSVQQPKLKKISELQSLSWINIIDPQENEINRISKLLGISVDTIRDAVDEFELPRIEVEGENVMMIIRTPVQANGVYTTLPLTIIINPKHITTISHTSINITEDIINRVVKTLTTQQSNFVIQICLRVMHYYQRYITIINKTVQKEKTNLDDISKEDIYKLIETEEILNNFITSLTPTINTIKKLLNNHYINLYQQDKDLINDLLIDGEQVRETSITNIKTIKNIRDGYTTIMSIKLNQTMKLLTYITASLTVPLIVASIYGMNIRLPLSNSPYAFEILSGIMLVLMVAAISAFAWLRNRY